MANDPKGKGGHKIQKIIGIDLGTTYSCVGVYQNGNVQIIPDEDGNRTIPSYVAFNEQQRLIGNSAKRQAAMNPSNTVFDSKRLIGRRFNEPIVQEYIKYWPFNIIDAGSRIKIEVNYKGECKQFFPEEISAMVLTKLKKMAETFLGGEVHDAVIAVPASFNNSQRQATKDAGQICGLNVIRIVNEPTAAALAYGLDLREEKDILVFDIGGGSIDVSILTLEDGIYEVIATNGNTELGGEDFDNRLISHFIEEFTNKHKRDITGNKKALSRLKIACEKAKRTLSFAVQAFIEIEPLFEDIDFYSSITRIQFEELCWDLFGDILESVEKALIDSKKEKHDINDIVLVGGCTRIPKIRTLLQNFFNTKSLCESVNLDEVVANGTATQASILNLERQYDEILLLDVVSHCYGIETITGEMDILIESNSIIPVKNTITFSSTGLFVTDNESGEVIKPLPLTYDRCGVVIKVYEGEELMAKDNTLLESFELSRIFQGAQVEVTFDFDSGSNLIVIAKDKVSGKEEKSSVNNKNGRFSKEGLDGMRIRAKMLAEDDETEYNRVEALNNLETYLFTMKGTIEEMNGDCSLPDDDKETIFKEFDKGMNWIDENPLAQQFEIEEKQKEIEDICAPIISKY